MNTPSTAINHAAVLVEGGSPEGCPLCGSERIAICYAQARDYITGDKFAVWKCAACDLAFTHPQPVSLDRYYPSRYRQYHPMVLWVLEHLYQARVQSWTRFFDRPG